MVRGYWDAGKDILKSLKHISLIMGTVHVYRRQNKSLYKLQNGLDKLTLLSFWNMSLELPIFRCATLLLFRLFMKKMYMLEKKMSINQSINTFRILILSNYPRLFLEF